MNNRKLNTFILLLVTLIVLIFALKDDFWEKVRYLFSFNIWYLLLAFGLMIIYWIFKAMVVERCAKKFNNNYSFKQAFKLVLDTQFVNGVTPFATGGQPYQVYRLKKQGFSLEKGTNIAIQDFIVYQIALILLGTIAIIANYYFHIFHDDLLLKKLVILGYLINFGVIIVLFIVAFNRKGNKFLLDLAVKVGARIGIIKDKEKFLNNNAETINNFHESAVILMESKWHFLKIILINFVALVVLYSIPYFLILGLGEFINPLVVIVASAYVMLIGSFVPIPGGSGGLEYGFTVFFGTFIVGAKLSIIMITWRFITYYFGLIIGAISINQREESSCE